MENLGLTRPTGWVTGDGPLAQYTQPHGFQQCVPGGSFDIAPMDLDWPDQLVDTQLRAKLALFGEMGIAEGGENGLMAEDFLYFQ